MPCVQFYFPSSCFPQSSIPVYFPQLLPIPIIPQCIDKPRQSFCPLSVHLLSLPMLFPGRLVFLFFFVVFPRLLDLVPSLNFVFHGLLFSYPLKGQL